MLNVSAIAIPMAFTNLNSATRAMLCVCRGGESAKLVVSSPFARYTGASKSTNSIMFDMFVKYGRALVTKGIVEDTDTFGSLDFIDTTPLYNQRYRRGQGKNPEILPAIDEYIDSFGFHGIIPCFSAGVITIASCLRVKYSVVHLDTDVKEMQLKCYAYFSKDKTGFPIDVPYCSFEFVVKYNLGSKNPGHLDTEIISNDTATSLYMAISPKKMKWTTDQCRLWRDTYVRCAKNSDEVDGEWMQDLVRDLVWCFGGVNYLMRRTSKRSAGGSSDIIGIAKFDENAQNSRKIRSVAPVQSSNERAPVEYVIHHEGTDGPHEVTYRVASWGVRGHARRYRDGRVVYIAPRVNHRRCVSVGGFPEDTTPASKTIKLQM